MENARKFIFKSDEVKPIIAIKSGRTVEGAKAASSHTGALAGADEMYDALFAQSGIIRAQTVEELLDLAVAFESVPIPKGNNICIVTNAGGPGIMTTDASIKYGLKLAKLEDATVAELKKYLPKTSNFNNPIDVIGDAQHDRYEAALSNVLKDKNVDGVIVLLTPQSVTDVEDIAESVAEIGKASEKPVLACFMGMFDVTKGIEILKSKKIPTFRFPEEAAETMSLMYRYGQLIYQPKTEPKKYDVDVNKVKQIFEKVRKDGRLYLPELESLEVLNAYGFPTLKSKLAKTKEEAVKAANEVGYPIVMKIVSPDIVHKFDAKGVIINLKTDAETAQAFDDMMLNAKTYKADADIWGVNIQELAKKGEETIVGAKSDEKFGPLVMFGLGGIYVEVLKDVTFGFAPLRPAYAMKMIRSVKMYKILEGIRGKPPADIESVADCLMRLSQLLIDFPEIVELDMNPIIVYARGEGCKVADVRILIK
jgi:acetyltransferase